MKKCRITQETNMFVMLGIALMLFLSSFEGTIGAAILQPTPGKTTSGKLSGDPLTLYEIQKILAPDGVHGDRFGSSVAIDGNVAVIGSRLNHDQAAYVYRFNGSQWIFEQKLHSSSGMGGDFFGYSVAISGNIIVVGAPAGDIIDPRPGYACVYFYDGSTWNEVAKIQASDSQLYARFGTSIALKGDTVIIGAPYYNKQNGWEEGSAYVYWNIVSPRIVESKLLASDGAEEDLFGFSVGIMSDTDGTVVIIGAPMDDDNGNNSGAAYVYTFETKGSLRATEQKILPSDGVDTDCFGYSVAIDGNVAIIGAPYKNGIDMYAGATYVFQNINSIWSETQKILAFDSTVETDFGISVALCGNLTVIRAMDNTNIGMAYVYQFTKPTWTGEFILRASDCETNTWWESPVALNGDIAIIGVSMDHTFTGSAYIFRIPNNFAIGDVNYDGVIDLGDVVYLISYLYKGGPPPIPMICVGDCNHDGNVDVSDVVYLINYLYKGGLPLSGYCG